MPSLQKSTWQLVTTCLTDVSWHLMSSQLITSTVLSPVNKKEQLLSKQNVGQLAVSPVIFHFLEISAAECFQYCTVCYSIPISTNSHRCRPQCLHRIPGISIAFVEASVKVKYFHVYGNDNPLKRGKKTSTCI